MMRRGGARLAAATALAGLALLAGCLGLPGRQTPTREYVLTALPRTDAASEREIAIGVGPVRMPQYLNRPQIVTRPTPNELRLAEFDLWGEPLQDAFTRVLAENLGVLLGTERVTVFPWSQPIPLRYRVAVDVTRFDGTLGGPSTLVARWAISRGDGSDLLAVKTSGFVEEAEGPDYAATVVALSRAVEQLSREITAEIDSLER